ncbi:uncharacterized protein [Dermacentor albipictus]|uniref:uncharacterized protein isoform X3 n=1 Tax=Dermacentor albipictus TaxID=60249 RepID=UPI0038FC5E40
MCQSALVEVFVKLLVDSSVLCVLTTGGAKKCLGYLAALKWQNFQVSHCLAAVLLRVWSVCSVGFSPSKVGPSRKQCRQSAVACVTCLVLCAEASPIWRCRKKPSKIIAAAGPGKSGEEAKEASL